MPTTFDAAAVAALNQQFAGATPQAVLEWALQQPGLRFGLASSFGAAGATSCARAGAASAKSEPSNATAIREVILAAYSRHASRTMSKRTIIA
mgnify:CR=1 FL=1